MVEMSVDDDIFKPLINIFFALDVYNNGVITKKELKTFFEVIENQFSDEEVSDIIENLHLRDKG